MANETGAPQTPPSGIDPHVDALEAQVRAMESALKATRNTRLVLLVGFVGLTAMALGLFGSLGKSLMAKSYQDELTETAKNFFDENMDEYSRVGQSLVETNLPVVKQALIDQAHKDSALYVQALNHERDEFLKELQERLEAQINQKHEETIARLENGLAEELAADVSPQMQERISANFRISLERMVKEHYIEAFQEELQAMYNAWDSFPVADPPDEGDLPADQQLIGYLVDLMVAKAAANSQLAFADETSESASEVESAVAPPEESPIQSPSTPESTSSK